MAFHSQGRAPLLPFVTLALVICALFVTAAAFAFAGREAQKTTMVKLGRTRSPALPLDDQRVEKPQSYVSSSKIGNELDKNVQGVRTAPVNHQSATLPADFDETQISGLTNPTAMTQAPDGRIFVCQQGGALRVIKNGAVLATPFVSLTVDSNGERGLLGVAFDPNFVVNQFVYVYYTTPTPQVHNRVSRFTANGDNAVPGSELVILDLNNLSGATNHNGGAIHFGPDGKLYVAVGENANGANAQTFSNLLGKILRINPDPMNLIPTDNPYFNDPTVSGNNKAIWALGLRNPFTFAFQQDTGRMFINDVGENAWEEVNEGVAHSNYGWSICEGLSCPSPPTSYRGPIYVYNHTTGMPTGCAIVGGAFYNPTTVQFPATYVGKYFFSDLCTGFIRYIDPDAPAPIASSTPFATGLSSPVDLLVSNDGSLYYLVRGGGSVFRIQFNGQTSQPTLAINDVAVTEGNAGSTTATFTVTLSQSSSQTVTVQYATADDTATIGNADYVSASGTLMFTPGQTSQTVSVTVNGDTTFEPNESFLVNLSTASNATIADSQGVGAINNDDPQPAISISDVALTEGNSGTMSATFAVTLSNPSSQTIIVNYATANGSATAGSDYVAASGTSTFGPGVVSQSLNITINGDTTFEPNENFFINLSTATNATIADTQGVGTINNDDAQPSISINDISVVEGNSGTTNANFTVSLTNASSQTITVNYATADGTATSNADYLSTAGTLTFAPDQTSRPISVTINGDLLNEPNEAFFVNLSSATNATIGDNQGIGTIVDDDSQPVISINDVSVNEGNSGTTLATFTVTLSAQSSQTVTVNYATSNGTATAGSDYVSANGTISFTPNQTSQLVSVTVNGDTNLEPNETFFVDLSLATNAGIGDGQGQATIINDDVGPPTFEFTQSNYDHNESTQSVTINVKRTGDPLPAASVDYETNSDLTFVECSVVNGQANQRCDYLLTTGTLSFAPNELEKSFTIVTFNDSYLEGNETFTLSLSNPSAGAVLGPVPTATVTILDDDLTAPTTNPIDVSRYFVRQTYYDFLQRTPDQGGEDFWTGEIDNACAAGDLVCINRRRVAVSAAFFVSSEFTRSGGYVYRLHKAAFGEQILYRPLYEQFSSDRAGVVDGVDLEQGKLALANDFVQRSEFTARYPNSSPAQFVDAILLTVQQGAGVTFSPAERQNFINDVSTGGRGLMLKNLGDNGAFTAAVFNRAFVLMQYFGYLRRDPDQGGYEFWLGILNASAQNFDGMVCAFITSPEYQRRFSPVVTRSDSSCK